MAEPPIAGSAAAGWEPIRAVFERNFAPTQGVPDDPGDLGAQLCVVHRGRVVVDLWGGWRDRDRQHPYTADTLVNSYSVGKGITAILALVAVSRGLVDLDQPVRRYWPEFGLDTSLRHHLSHRAGLPALRGEHPDHLPMDWAGMCAALASTEPWWVPGTDHGYHTNTYGFLVGEPVRRACGAGRFGDLLHDWFTGPRGADLHLGVGDDDLHRCAEMGFSFGGSPPADAATTEFADEHARMRHHAYFNPPTVSGIGVIETAEWRKAEVPSTNLHATAKGVAFVYAAAIESDGPVDPEVLAEATSTQSDGHDLILERRSRFGLGFQLHQDDRPVGVSEDSFGHYGFGGSIGFADPIAELAVGYVLNRPGDRWQIPRTKRLLDALRLVVGRSS